MILRIEVQFAMSSFYRSGPSVVVCRKSEMVAIRHSGGRGRGLAERVNAVLLAPEGRRDWPLRFYSAELLFSKEARLGWAEPDLGALPEAVDQLR